MANITVPNTSTFEQWRVKTNDISDAVGDVDDLTSLITGGTDVVASLTDIKDVSDTNTTSIGTIGSLYGNGTYTDLVSATGDLDTRTTTNATNITSNDVDIATNLASIGTIGSLYGSQEDLVSAAEDLGLLLTLQASEQ